MKHIALALMLAAAAFPMAALADQPPLIDRNLFYGEVAIAGAQISPDGQYLSFLKPYKGTRNIWVKGADEPFSAARPVSAEATRPIRNYFWSYDSKYIVYAQDSGGDENFNVYAIDPKLPADRKTGVPPTRALTNLQGVRTQIFAVPKAKPDILYIGLNDRDPKWHDLYELSISTGEKKLLRKNTDEIAVWQFDDAGTLRLAERTTKTGDTEILRVDADGFKPLYTCSVLENCGPFDFDASGKHVYFATNKGALDLTELDMLDVNSGAATKIESDPEKRADLYNVEISRLDHRILFTRIRRRHVPALLQGSPFRGRLPLAAIETAGHGSRFRRPLERREHLDRQRATAIPNRATSMCGIASQKRWRCSTGCARKSRANRCRSASRTTTNRRTAWRSPLI